MLSRFSSAGCGVSWLALGIAASALVGCGEAERKGVALGTVAQALTVSAEVIGTDPPVPFQYSTGAYLGVANDGTNSAVVFYDGGRIRGVRYDEFGTVLDMDEWIRLGEDGDGAPNQAYADVAYGGGIFLAVYDDFSDQGGVYAQGFRSDGTLVSEPVLVAQGGYYGSVVFNGTDFTVTWCDGDLGLARVALDGAVVPGSKTTVTTGSTTNRSSLAMVGDVGVAVFEQAVGDVRRVYAARFDAAGQVLDPGGILISGETTSSVDVSVAAGGAEFLAVWSESVNGAILGSIIGTDGEVRASEFAISRSPATARAPAVAYDGSQYLVVWSDDRDTEPGIYGTRLRADGSSVDAADVALGTGSRVYQAWDIDLSWGNDRYSLAYVGDGIVGRFLSSDLTVLEPGALELTPVPNAQILFSSVWDGSQYVLGYSDERAGDDLGVDQLRSVRIDDAGNNLTPDGIILADGPEQTTGVSMASNGQTTLITWWNYEANSGYRRTLDPSGALSAPVTWAAGAEMSYGTSSNGENFVALYSAGDNGVGNDNEIWSQLFDAAGAPDGSPTQLVTVSRPRWTMEPLGSEYVVAYSGQEIDGTSIDGAVLVLAADGTVADEFEPVVGGIVTTSASGNGQQMLFSWKDGATEALMGRILDRGEGWGEAFRLADPAVEGAAAIAWDGAAFVVVWAADRTAMWSRTVSPDGSLGAAEPLFLGDYGWPTLTAGPEGQMLLSYVRWLESSRSRRVESRLVGDIGDAVAVAHIGADSIGDGGSPSVEPVEPDPAADGGADPVGSSGGSSVTTGGSTAGSGGNSTVTGGGTQLETGGTGGRIGSFDSMGGVGAATSSETGNAAPTSSGTGGAGASTTGSTSTPDASSGATSSVVDPEAGVSETGATVGASTGDQPSSDEGGCSVSGAGHKGAGLGWVAALAGTLALRRRRAAPKARCRSRLRATARGV